MTKTGQPYIYWIVASTFYAEEKGIGKQVDNSVPSTLRP